MYPQQPAYPAQPYPAQAPVEQYPAQQYPAQQPYPQAPVQPQYPAMPQYPQAPVQQYGQPAPAYYPPQPPAQPTVSGTLDGFFNQRSAGGKALSFTPGTTHTVIVTRKITNGDIQQQTDTQNRPQFFKDGSPKFVMVVPVQLFQPTAEFPDGMAAWYVKGQARDELVRAMAEAGAPEGPPEAGAVLQITCTGERQIRGLNPAKQFRVVYQRPGAAQPAMSAAPAPAPVMQQPGPQYAQPVPQYAQPAQPGPQQVPQYAQPMQQPAMQQPVAPPQPAMSVVQPAAQPSTPGIPTSAPAPAAGAGQLSPEQMALLQQLTGQQAA